MENKLAFIVVCGIVHERTEDPQSSFGNTLIRGSPELARLLRSRCSENFLAASVTTP